MSTINTVPRAIIKASLYGLRLPLTTIERVTHNAHTNWAPALAYESFEAQTKRILGSLVRDDALVQEGRLQRVKVGEFEESERLGTKAEQQRQSADSTLQVRQDSVEGARVRIEQEARRRDQRLNEEKADQQQRVRQAAERRKRAATKAAEVRRAVVSTEEKNTDRTRVAEQSAALAKRDQALGAAKEAQSLETELAARKARRKNS